MGNRTVVVATWWVVVGLMSVGVAAHAADRVTADVDGDGRADAAWIQLEQGEVVVSVRRGSDTAAPVQRLAFAVDASQQAAICDLPASLAVHPLFCSPADEPLPGCRNERRSKEVTLTGGDCDPIHLYWNHDAGRVTWWRD